MDTFLCDFLSFFFFLKEGAGLEVERLEYKLVPVWDPGGEDLATRLLCRSQECF